MNNKLTPLALLGLALTIPQVSADANDRAALNNRVDQHVQQITAMGLLPTALEIEVITGDIIDNEVVSTELTVDQAINKYELVPALARYIAIKEASRALPDIVTNGSGDGNGDEPAL